MDLFTNRNGQFDFETTMSSFSSWDIEIMPPLCAKTTCFRIASGEIIRFLVETSRRYKVGFEIRGRWGEDCALLRQWFFADGATTHQPRKMVVLKLRDVKATLSFGLYEIFSDVITRRDVLMISFTSGFLTTLVRSLSHVRIKEWINRKRIFHVLNTWKTRNLVKTRFFKREKNVLCLLDISNLSFTIKIKESFWRRLQIKLPTYFWRQLASCWINSISDYHCACLPLRKMMMMRVIIGVDWVLTNRGSPQRLN